MFLKPERVLDKNELYFEMIGISIAFILEFDKNSS
jgi:hypothetical protein